MSLKGSENEKLRNESQRKKPDDTHELTQLELDALNNKSVSFSAVNKIKKIISPQSETK
jgi:hypothetical protein